MSKIQQLIHFTRKEKNAIITFIVLQLLLTLLPFCIPFSSSKTDLKIETLAVEMDSLKAQEVRQEKTFKSDSHYEKDNIHHSHNARITLKPFDPNVLTIEQWIAIGVKESTAQTIQKYLNKGGRFRKPEDLKKIWGMPASLAEALIPYVRLESNQNENKSNIQYDQSFHTKPKTIIKLSINNADSTQWESLPGIGPVLASRIVTYRNRLGGFYAVEQLKEVYGLKDSVYQLLANRLHMDDGPILIDINNISREALQQHPYFGKKISAIITNYRNQHGNFKSLEEIQNIIALDENSYRKISHYLKVKSD